jgi:hypothetical protein
MTIKIGTIQEMTGEGLEYLVDSDTRSYVLAKFFNGNLIDKAESEVRVDGREVTLVPSAA